MEEPDAAGARGCHVMRENESLLKYHGIGDDSHPCHLAVSLSFSVRDRRHVLRLDWYSALPSRASQPAYLRLAPTECDMRPSSPAWMQLGVRLGACS